MLVATYTIGKEKILLEIARQCHVPIAVDGAKLKILEQLELLPTAEAMAATFTTNMSASDVRFVKWHQCGESVRGSRWAQLSTFCCLFAVRAGCHRAPVRTWSARFTLAWYSTLCLSSDR